MLSFNGKLERYWAFTAIQVKTGLLNLMMRLGTIISEEKAKDGSLHVVHKDSDDHHNLHG